MLIDTQIKIAIADDHAIFRDALSRLLSLEDDFHVVAQVDDGLRVVQVLAQHAPERVEMTGVPVRRLRAPL